MEPLSTILPFSVNEPLLDLPNYPGNRYLGLGTLYGDKIRIILKLRTCSFTSIHREPLSMIFALSLKDPLPDTPNFIPKWITWSMNTLWRKNIVHIEACNLYFQVRYTGTLNQ